MMPELGMRYQAPVRKRIRPIIAVRSSFVVTSGDADAGMCIGSCFLSVCANVCVVIQSRKSGMVMMLAEEM